MNKFLGLRSYLYLFRRNMSAPSSGPMGSMSPKYRPSEFQKIILVWTKKYKTKEEIPQLVSPDVIDRARSEARIKISNILMLLTALASLGAILSGKAAAKRGESVHQMNLDWHKQYNDNYSKQNPVAEDKK